MQSFKSLYLNSIKELKITKNLVFCGLMGALAIVLGAIATINIGPYIRIGFSGLPNRIVDFLFGPVVGSLFGGMLDVLKFIVKPTGPFFFGFTFDAMLAGILFGSILYKKPLTIWRVLLAEFLCKLIVNCGFNTLWISILYGKGFLAILPARLIKNLVMLPIDTAMVYFSCAFVNELKSRMNF